MCEKGHRGAEQGWRDEGSQEADVLCASSALVLTKLQCQLHTQTCSFSNRGGKGMSVEKEEIMQCSCQLGLVELF